jgi:hypothetical protein
MEKEGSEMEDHIEEAAQMRILINKLEWHQFTKYVLLVALLIVLLSMWFFRKSPEESTAYLWVIFALLVLTTFYYEIKILRLRIKWERNGTLPNAKPCKFVRDFSKVDRYKMRYLVIDLGLLFYLVALTGGLISIFMPSIMLITSLAGYCLVEKESNRKNIYLNVTVVVLYVLNTLFVTGHDSLKKYILFMGIVPCPACVNVMVINGGEINLSILWLNLVFYIIVTCWANYILSKISRSFARSLKAIND